ncbi:hypothetical protein [Massilia varians]|uniref:hypothetical protein n=1 Tax=Massilia varians TaxID=457921 RepID=UPI0025559D6E|nr:hypothetical protein [Massilia varians]MDK6078657.1 hypothetical protein [Massilia varians]
MTIQSALANLRRRQPNFTTLRAALEHNELPTSNGWAGLERKYGDLQLPAMTIASYVAKLEKIYRSNIEWGDKAIQFAIFENKDSALLEEAVNHKFKREYNPTVAFPKYVSDEELASLTLRPKLVISELNSTRTGVTLYFYSRAYETEKETFVVDDMKDEVSIKRFAGYDQVVAYRQLTFQRIDSVYIDARNKRIEFRVDATRLRTTDRMVDALKELKAAFRDLMQNQVNQAWEKVSFSLVNFFPKIDMMYQDSKGHLVELGHNTAAGSINHGKMRGLKGNMKEDPSHVASMSASATEKFAIQKAYSYYKDLSVVRLKIPGKSADTGSATPTINLAIVEDCIDGKQFDDMMQLLR